MSNFSKALMSLTAILAVIALGLFWPVEDSVDVDPFRMTLNDLSLDNLAAVPPELPLEDVVSLHSIQSDMTAIRKGRFKYREDDPSWRFTTPIDWAKSHPTVDVMRVVQQFAMADPFLKSYAETGEVEDFRQAVFFFLDWQTFYQDGQHITDYAWDIEAASARAARLAFLLSEINKDRELLADRPTLRLIELADFHVQRVTDPIYGTTQDEILSRSEFKALCSVVRLRACELKS